MSQSFKWCISVRLWLLPPCVLCMVPRHCSAASQALAVSPWHTAPFSGSDPRCSFEPERLQLGKTPPPQFAPSGATSLFTSRPFGVCNLKLASARASCLSHFRSRDWGDRPTYAPRSHSNNCQLNYCHFVIMFYRITGSGMDVKCSRSEGDSSILVRTE